MITIWVPKRLVEIDLCNVAARSGPELAAACEDSYARRLRYAAQKIRQSGAKIIMLTGFSDFVCPPTSVYTAFHNLPETTRKALYTNPLDGHMTGNAEASRRIRNYIFKH